MRTLFSLFFVCLFFQTSSYLFPRDFFAFSPRTPSLLSKLDATTTSTTIGKKVSLEEFLARKEGPDFFWKYRLERLKKKKADVYPFDPSNYTGKHTDKELYEIYYLDLVLKGKMEGFDIEKEQVVDEDEWRLIFRDMAAWTREVEQSVPKESIPDSPFDLLSIFFPEMRPAFQELEAPLNDPDIPYKTTREFVEDAFRGNFPIKGVTAEDDSAEFEKQLDTIEAESLQRVHDLRQRLLQEVESDQEQLDEQSKAFYRRAKELVNSTPITQAEWDTESEKTKRLVEEMAELAAAEDEEHHHHDEEHEGHDEHHEKKLSIPEQFKQRYGRDLKKMQERLGKFSANPNNYLEVVAVEAAGKEGLDLWKEIEKSFEDNYSKLSEQERVKLQQDFKTFVNGLPLN